MYVTVVVVVAVVAAPELATGQEIELSGTSEGVELPSLSVTPTLSSNGGFPGFRQI